MIQLDTRSIKMMVESIDQLAIRGSQLCASLLPMEIPKYGQRFGWS
jgi:hypothetical protein